MDDFASAAMLRLIQRGLARQGLGLPGAAAAAAAPGRSAHVPLARKRALLDGLLAAHGPLALLRIGEAIADVPDEPALLALTLATDPPDLLARWQRLERFIHARHRVLLQADGPNGLHLRHVSLAAHAPPSPAEDLLVLGLLVALAQAIGTPGLQASAGRPAGWRWRAGGWQSLSTGPASLPHGLATADWHWRWSPPPVVLSAPRGTARPQADWTGADWARAATRLLSADPGRPWTVEALARALACSPRSLQRQLARHGLRFSHLLVDVRLAQSARLLATTAQPAAAIGYHCGFADQAHFSRAFKQHSAMTPGQYRSAFSAGDSARQPPVATA